MNVLGQIKKKAYQIHNCFSFSGACKSRQKKYFGADVIQCCIVFNNRTINWLKRNNTKI